MTGAPLPIPNGWFYALHSEDLAPGGVKPLRYLERELVAFRGHDGQAAILDAYCPHLGAHLGRGGTVEGNRLRCPFHAWEYDVKGRCTQVPYAKRIPPGARVRAYPTVERNGAVYFWHDAGGAPPAFEIPEIPEWGDPAFASSWQRHEWTVRTHPQEVLENGIDWAHVMPVHGFETPGKIVCNFEGPRFDWGLDTGKSIELLGDAQDSFRFRVHSYGLGVSEVHYEGRFATVFQIGQTPVEADTTRITFSILTRKSDEADPETAPALRAYVEDQVRTFEQDFPIWENKLYRERPPLCDADGPIPEFRNWAAQFYPPVAEMQTPT
jgi:nitrite reductase/ring-hydroxylating ferredoxin subunit